MKSKLKGEGDDDDDGVKKSIVIFIMEAEFSFNFCLTVLCPRDGRGPPSNPTTQGSV